jgi:hypothetical protein
MSQAFKQAFLTCMLIGSAGCNWSAFNNYERDAPIRVYDAPTNYGKPGFGSVLTTLTTNYTGSQRSIAIASAGPDSAIVFARLWNGKHVTEDAFTRCKNKDCAAGAGVGSALIAFPSWALGTPQQQDGCVFAPALGKSFVFCDSDTNANQSFSLELDQVVDKGNYAGFSGAGLPLKHPLGVFLLGAYQISSRTDATSHGRLFYQPDFQPEGERSDGDEVPQLEELPLRDPATGELFADDPDAGDLGFAMAALPSEDGTLWIAVGQPSRGRVLVAIYDRTVVGGLENKLSTVACLDSPAGGGSFGKRVAMGDINGDGLPEIAVGSDAVDSNETVFVYPGDALPMASPTSCPAWGAHPLVVICSEGVRDARCENSAFGAAVAFGDVNGDGAQDLLVGAPLAEVSGKQAAGAVWLFAGNSSGRGALLDLDGATNLHADNKAQAHLGATVAALHTRDRDEPVASAPNEDRLFTFMCSELEDDVSGNTQCLPK